MNDRVIQVTGVGKQYQLGAIGRRHDTFRGQLAEVIRMPFRTMRAALVDGNERASEPDKTDFWALRDVSFEIQRGEVTGIVGRNGAGKSTLLKILSRITDPTTGRLEINGRVGSLLEVGTGFHPELTGRDNIFLNGAILGMTRAEIARQFDEIVAFSEVERFIDTPVKHYSSGMYLRLAFAVAAHLQTEILVVDEVLAVGDAAFQQKCMRKMNASSREGRTVLFVSHNMGALARLCHSAIWLEGGAVREIGPVAKILAGYQATHLTVNALWENKTFPKAGSRFSFRHISVSREDGDTVGVFAGDEPVHVNIRYTVHSPLNGCQVGVRINNAEGTTVFYTSDSDETPYSATGRADGTYSATFIIPRGLLTPGTYTVFVAAHLPFREVYDSIEQAVTFAVSESGSLTARDGRLGVITPLLPWRTERLEIDAATCTSVGCV